MMERLINYSLAWLWGIVCTAFIKFAPNYLGILLFVVVGMGGLIAVTYYAAKNEKMWSSK